MSTDEYINVDKLIDKIWELDKQGRLTVGALIAKIATVERYQIEFSSKNGFGFLRVRPAYKIRGGLTMTRCGYEIDELDLSVRVYNVLLRAGITTISDLKKLEDFELEKIRDF